jgi:NAD-dependent deacetylase
VANENRYNREVNPVDHARALLANAAHPVVFTGAGVSADSGVPTFRGSSTDALWGKYSPQQLASPQGFRADPTLVYEWYRWRRSQLAKVEPNPAHHAIAALQRRGGVVITQNVDGLHERVAPDGATVLRLHGTLAEDRCEDHACEQVEAIDFDNQPLLRRCPQCGSNYMRPSVVWFGEALDRRVWDAAEVEARGADVMLVVGTSGEVWPAAGLVELASRRGEVIVVNPEPGPLDEWATVVVRGGAAEAVPAIVP